MKLEIVRIIDRGIANNERLHLKVLVPTSLDYFVVFDTNYITPQALNRTAKNVFWFPKRAVQVGDFVLLYTNAGEDTQQKNTDGTTSHFFHWGKPNTLWTRTGDCAVLFELNSWQTSIYE